jgi:replicative DNA helicase
MSTLGSMLLREEAAEEVLGYLDDADFYRPAHRIIFAGMRRLYEANIEVDMVSLKDNLLRHRAKTGLGKKAEGPIDPQDSALAACGGIEYLIQIQEYVPSAANAMHYAAIVRERAVERSMLKACDEIQQLTLDTEIDIEDRVSTAQSKFGDIARVRTPKDFRPLRELGKEFFIEVDQIIETGVASVGMPVGFYDLDAMTTGLYGGNLFIIAARPSMGKTALAINIALNVARSKIAGAVAVFSLEMSDLELTRRMVAMLSGVAMDAVKKTSLSHDYYQRMADACEVMYAMPVYVDDGGETTPIDMRSKCRRLKAEHGLALIVVDYLQLMRTGKKHENRQQEVSEIARALKALAKEMDCPVIALSQLNRGVEAREDKRPVLSDLRDSGSIEAEADMVAAIYRPQYYKAKEEHVEQTLFDVDRIEESEIIMLKNRNGPTGKITLGFQPVYARFLNLRK